MTYRNSYFHFIDPWVAVAVYTDTQTHTQTHYRIPRLRMRTPRQNYGRSGYIFFKEQHFRTKIKFIGGSRVDLYFSSPTIFFGFIPEVWSHSHNGIIYIYASISYNMGTRDCMVYIALKPEGWVQYTPCNPSARVITSLYPKQHKIQQKIYRKRLVTSSRHMHLCTKTLILSSIWPFNIGTDEWLDPQNMRQYYLHTLGVKQLGCIRLLNHLSNNDCFIRPPLDCVWAIGVQLLICLDCLTPPYTYTIMFNGGVSMQTSGLYSRTWFRDPQHCLPRFSSVALWLSY